MPTIRELTKIPLSRLQIGLSVLIQYHIVLHSVDDYDRSFFQVDWHSAYVLIRTEKIQRLVGERHGDLAAQIVDQVLQLGLVSVGDLAEEYTHDSATKQDSTIDETGLQEVGGEQATGIHKSNGVAHESPISTPQLHETLTTLLEHGFLLKVGPRSFLPATDLQQYMHDTVVSDSFPDGRISGPKKQKEFKIVLNGLKRKWKEEDRFSASRDTVSRGSVKRVKTGAYDGQYSKVNGVGQHGGEAFGSKLPVLSYQ